MDVLEDLLREIMTNAGIRRRIDDDDLEGALNALERAGIVAENRPLAALRLRNLNYGQLQQLAQAFGFPVRSTFVN